MRARACAWPGSSRMASGSRSRGRRAAVRRHLGGRAGQPCSFATTRGRRISHQRRGARRRRAAATAAIVTALGERRAERAVSAMWSRRALVLVPDKETYQPGDTAHVLVQAPFADGRGAAHRSAQRHPLHRDTSRWTAAPPRWRFRSRKRYLPNVNIQVDVNGSAPRLDDKGKPVEGAPPQPAYATRQPDRSTSRR